MTDTLNVVVCGGGRTGHLNATLFKQAEGVHVSLLSRNAEAIRSHMPETGIEASLPDGRKVRGRLDRISDDPAIVMADADVVILTVPAHVRSDLLALLRPHLPTDRTVHIGAIPGFCGFDWLAEKVFAGHDNVVIWGMKDVPYTAYAPQPGVSVVMGGAKKTLHVATHDRHDRDTGLALRALLQRLYPAPVELLGSYLEITLTPGNPIMHSSVLYGLIGPYSQWDRKPFTSEIYWWKECPELGAYFLQRSDEENQELCRGLEKVIGSDLSSIHPIKDEIIDAYGDQIEDPRTLLTVLRTNRAYLGKVPLVPVEGNAGYLVDIDSRAFQEDVPYGLSLLVEMGRRIGVAIPHIETIFSWCVSHMGGLNRSALEYFPEAWPERVPPSYASPPLLMPE